jgi:hypothetical protein
MIANAIDQYAGEGFWDILSDRDKRKILTATFNQDPLWVIRKFRAHDSVAVDFGEICLGTTEEQIGWQKFYRWMFVDMAVGGNELQPSVIAQQRNTFNAPLLKAIEPFGR